MERGLEYWDRLRMASQSSRPESSSYLMKRLAVTYNLPFISNWIKRVSFFKYIPLCPTYNGLNFLKCKRTPSKRSAISCGDEKSCDTRV